jgi:hypothetical protein
MIFGYEIPATRFVDLVFSGAVLVLRAQAGRATFELTVAKSSGDRSTSRMSFRMSVCITIFVGQQLWIAKNLSIVKHNRTKFL